MIEEDDWDPPDSYGDALERYRVLVAEIQEIQAQLGDKRRKRHTSQAAFAEWRYKSTWALTLRLEELRLVKKWIREQRTLTTQDR